MKKQVKVGVGAIIVDGDRTLLAKRKGSHGEGLWGSMGGHMEFGETPQETVIREAKEELGIRIGNLKYLCTIDFQVEGKHYVDIGFEAEIVSGEPEIMEEDKISEIKWFEIDELPENVFPPVMIYLEARRTGKRYFE